MISPFYFLILGRKKPKFIAPPVSSSSDFDSSSSASSRSKRNSSPPPKPKKYKIPKITDHKLKNKEVIEALRGDLPNLNHHPDAVLQNLSWTELFRLDSKLGLHSKSSKKFTEWLQKNLEKIKKNPIKIEAGEDNRSNKLHSSRQPHLPKLRYLATSSRIYWNLWSRSYFQIRRWRCWPQRAHKQSYLGPAPQPGQQRHFYHQVIPGGSQSG